MLAVVVPQNKISGVLPNDEGSWTSPTVLYASSRGCAFELNETSQERWTETEHGTIVGSWT